jgi:hypothetical protein
MYSPIPESKFPLLQILLRAAPPQSPVTPEWPQTTLFHNLHSPNDTLHLGIYSFLELATFRLRLTLHLRRRPLLGITMNI